MNDWVELEHRLLKELRELNILNKKILVGVSGGVDSVALLWSLVRVKKTDIVACYVHHGDGESVNYRDQAAKFVHDFCVSLKIPFQSRKNDTGALYSEEEFREFRYEQLREVKKQTSADLLALGHHRDDLLETRLLRLIRGTGPQGLMAMQVLQADLYRPFLKLSKQELKAYLQHFNIPSYEDPSNESVEPLRNWLRNTWLPELESRQEGALNALARSLETLTEALIKEDDFKEIFRQKALLRANYLALSKTQQKQVLAKYLLERNVRNFTQSHLEEAMKRLDNSQKEFTFKLAGVNWIINAEQIRVQDSE